MAQEPAVRGTKLLIQVGGGGSPETFTHDCLINTERSFGIAAETSDFPTFDCNDPEAVSWLQREKVSLSADISGGGRLHTADLSTYDAWARSLDPKNVKITINAPAANGGGSWLGAYHLTEFRVTGGDKGSTIEVAITLQSTGEVGDFVPAV